MFNLLKAKGKGKRIANRIVKIYRYKVPRPNRTYNIIYESTTCSFSKVERARNLETRHATVLLQESGHVTSDWTKIYFLGATLAGSGLLAAGINWI
jgi:hypothetical protein